MKTTIPLQFIRDCLRNGGYVIPSPNSGNVRFFIPCISAGQCWRKA